MACPNFKNGPKNGLGPLGVNKPYVEWSRVRRICPYTHLHSKNAKIDNFLF
jgi:hypothetical protein